MPRPCAVIAVPSVCYSVHKNSCVFLSLVLTKCLVDSCDRHPRVLLEATLHGSIDWLDGGVEGGP